MPDHPVPTIDSNRTDKNGDIPDSPTEDLAGLAVKINDAHALCRSATQTYAEYALQAGEALLRVKATVGHGASYPGCTTTVPVLHGPPSYIRRLPGRPVCPARQMRNALRIWGRPFAGRWKRLRRTPSRPHPVVGIEQHQDIVTSRYGTCSV